MIGSSLLRILNDIKTKFNKKKADQTYISDGIFDIMYMPDITGQYKGIGGWYPDIPVLGFHDLPPPPKKRH